VKGSYIVPNSTLEAKRSRTVKQIADARVIASGADTGAEHMTAEATPADPDGDNASDTPQQLDGSGPRPEPGALAAELERLVRAVVSVEELSQRARDAAATDLEEYMSLVASCRQFELSLEDAMSIRQRAQAVLEQAFGIEAKAAAEPLVLDARQVEQAFDGLISTWRSRAEVFLRDHADVQSLIAERRRQEEHARQQAAAAARTHRLEAILTQADEALAAGLVEETRSLIGVLREQHPDEHAAAKSLEDRLTLLIRTQKDAAALEALKQATEHQARGDLEAAVIALENVDVHGLSKDVGEDVFGRWSDACSRMAQAASVALLRFAPAKGRGIILYRDAQYPNGLVVFSSLGMGNHFPQGKIVTDPIVLDRARGFREARAMPDLDGWATSALAMWRLRQARPSGIDCDRIIGSPSCVMWSASTGRPHGGPPRMSPLGLSEN
jgi:hypothetical protein